MGINLKFNEEAKYIEISVTGDFSLKTLKNITEEVIIYIKKYKCNYILNDLRNATLTESPLSVYSMPKIAIKAGIERKIKRAIIVNELASDYHFLETVFVNQGNIVKLFDDFNKAETWLLEGKKN